MSELEERPETAITVATHDEDAHDLSVHITTEYAPPIDGTDDQFAAADMAIVKTVRTVLQEHYFGYPWHVKSEIRQGIVAFNIPSLMGETLHQVIVLRRWPDLTEDLIVRLGGDLLERMNLRRGPMVFVDYALALGRKHTFQFGDKKRH
jgi:hypothetical protein